VKKLSFPLLLLLVVVFAVPHTGWGSSDKEGPYRESVMRIFKTHIRHLEKLISTGSRYPQQYVKHAVAIQNTSQLLNHFFPNEFPEIFREAGRTRKNFDRLVQDSQRASKNLVKAAKKVRNEGVDQMSTALEAMKEACRSCHKNVRDWP